MIQVNLRELDIPEDLRQKLREKTDEIISIEDAEVRKDFIKNNASLWREIRPYLVELTGNSQNDAKCWYCECKGPGFTYHVDHFRPKNRVNNDGEVEELGYWWLAFDFMNYRLSCQRCNTGGGKRDQFPLVEGCKRAREPNDDIRDEVIFLLDPAKPGDPVFLSFSEDGKAYPKEQNDSIVAKKAEISINVYDLNHVSKVEARKQTWLECKMLVNRAERAMDQLCNASPETVRLTQERFEDICEDIQNRMSSNEQFSAMARYCFRGTGEEWLIDLIP